MIGMGFLLCNVAGCFSCQELSVTQILTVREALWLFYPFNRMSHTAMSEILLSRFHFNDWGERSGRFIRLCSPPMRAMAPQKARYFRRKSFGMSFRGWNSCRFCPDARQS